MFLEKNPHVPYPFKVTGLSRTVIDIQAPNCQLRSKAHTAPTAPLVLHRTGIGKCAMKNSESIASCRINFFFIVVHRFSLLKAVMNAPCTCKLCNGVNKTPPFLHFLIGKGRTKTIAHFSISEGLCVEAQLGAFSIVNCGMKKRFNSSA